MPVGPGADREPGSVAPGLLLSVVVARPCCGSGTGAHLVLHDQAPSAGSHRLRGRPGRLRGCPAHATRGRPSPQEAKGYVLRRIGSWTEAIDELEAAVSLDPLNAELISALGQTHQVLGAYASAEVVLERAIAVDPTSWSARFDRGLNDVLRSGDLGRLREALDAILGDASDDNRIVEFTRWWVAYVEGDEVVARRVASGIDDPLEQQAAIHPRPLLEALVHRAMGRDEIAVIAADSARMVLEELVRVSPTDPRLHSAVGLAYALIGLREKAVRAGREAVRLLPVTSDGMDGPEFLLQLARIHALVGDVDVAADLLRELFAAPSRHSLVSVLLEPAFSELRGHPGLPSRTGR